MTQNLKIIKDASENIADENIDNLERLAELQELVDDGEAAELVTANVTGAMTIGREVKKIKDEIEGSD